MSPARTRIRTTSESVSERTNWMFFCAIFVHSDLLDLTHPSALVLNTTPAVKDPVQSMRQGVYSVW